MITVLRPQPLQRLTSALERAVQVDPALGPACATLRQPLKLLSALATEAEAALADDHRAMERLRLMLAMTAARSIALKRELLDDGQGAEGTNADGARARDTEPGPLCEAGLVDLGALVIVGLAAGRVGRRQKMPGLFVDTVLGVALSAAPAESLARSLASGLEPEQVTAILGGLFASEAGADSALVPTFLDACEQARWRCLDRVFREVRRQAQETPWEATDSSLITRVAPGDAADTLSIQLRQPDASESELKEALKAAKRKLHVVFASPGRATISVPAELDSDDRATVQIPEHARAGWVGISTKQMRERATRARSQLREHWQRLAESACLRDSKVPVDALAASGDHPTAPVPTAPSAWGVRIVELGATRPNGGRLAPGQPALVNVTLSSAQAKRVELVLAGKSRGMQLAGTQATLKLEAREIEHGAGLTVRVFSLSSTRPDDEQAMTLELRARSEAPASGPGASSGEPRPSSPPSSGPTSSSVDVQASHRTRPFVFVRPALIKGVGFERVLAASADELAARMGLNRKRLPWIADEEILFERDVDDAEGPGAAALLEQLDRLAARSSGLEDATWVALVPSDGGRRYVFQRTGSESARELILATPLAFEEQGLSEEPAAGSRVTRRLRVIGSIEPDGVVISEPVRAERRAAGPGAEHLTDFVAVAIDARGRDVSSRRVRTTHPLRSGTFAVLLPITEDVVAVELRHEPELFAVELRAQPRLVSIELSELSQRNELQDTTASARTSSSRRPPRKPLPVIARPSGESLLKLEYDDDTRLLRWVYRHEAGVRPRYEVELRTPPDDGAAERAREVWRPVALPDSFSSEARVALDRVGPDLSFDRIRLVASDGWSVVVTDEAASMPAPTPNGGPPPGDERGTQLRIRGAGRLRYWSDLFFRGSVDWRVQPRADREPELEISPQGAVVRVPEAFIGRQLIATAHVDDGFGTKVFQDHIQIGAE
jgi:hypothetical protein